MMRMIHLPRLGEVCRMWRQGDPRAAILGLQHIPGCDLVHRQALLAFPGLLR